MCVCVCVCFLCGRGAQYISLSPLTIVRVHSQGEGVLEMATAAAATPVVSTSHVLIRFLLIFYTAPPISSPSPHLPTRRSDVASLETHASWQAG